ncbi:pilin [Ekhidna sp.]|uniref:pilin n=1 Tax=Ekhidna sp. TaxID=2608089 RepID=UPI0032F040F7
MEVISNIINWFGLVYVGIPLLAIVILSIYFIWGGKISKENLEKLIEISKWYIVSVAIVFSAKTIEAGFTEREAGIKEMQVYDKYVATILEADNIETRWKLAQYFSTVTPTERLRDRWIAYKDTIKSDYKKFKELEETENKLLSQATLTQEEQQKLNTVQQEKATYERSLLEINVGRWVIVFTGDTNLQESEYELNNLKNAGIENPKIFYRGNYFRTISKIFTSKSEAAAYLDAHKSKLRSDVYIVNLDKWCPNEHFTDKYYTCE